MYLISFIRRVFLKLSNFLFGRTQIFIYLLGWFLIITGALFLAQPEKARSKLIAHSFWMLKWQLFLACVLAGMFLISLSSKAAGIISTLLFAAGTIGMIWLFLFFRRKTRQKLTEKLSLVPIRYLKIFAVAQIGVGAAMLMLHKRIW